MRTLKEILDKKMRDLIHKELISSFEFNEVYSVNFGVTFNDKIHTLINEDT